MGDLILYNGKLYTQDAEHPEATAVAVRSGRILAVGSDDEIRSLAGWGTPIIDLEGRRVLPGLTDSHFHFYNYALGRGDLKLAGAPSLEAVREKVRERVAASKPGEWIFGQGWNESGWTPPRMPDRGDLDDIAPHNPMVLWRSDLHLSVANSLAMEKAGITRRTPSPADGVIDHDEQGEPTGIFRELAMDLLEVAFPESGQEDTLQAMREAFGDLHRLGLTGLHDYRIMSGDDGPPAFQAYQRLQAAKEVRMRLWMHLPLQRLDEAIALGLRSGFGDDYLRVGHVKMFTDGSQGARTAWMLEPYLGSDQTGLPLTPMQEIAEAVHKAHNNGIGVAIHAIGDRANRELIAVFEEVLQRGGQGEKALSAAVHRIEHVQNIRPDDVEKLGRLGVAASVQPVHALDDLELAEATVGERSRYMYVFRDLLDAGVLLALGSDCPVADPNPFVGIHAAVTRQRADGTPQGGWHPQQRLTLAEAIWGYTMGPALVCGQQDEQGSLTPGKLGDLVVLDRDIFEIDPLEIAQVKPWMTVFDGDVVYSQDESGN
jgi:predicted amidohydrolase YtcJ